jgi:hypothetical protein
MHQLFFVHFQDVSSFHLPDLLYCVFIQSHIYNCIHRKTLDLPHNYLASLEPTPQGPYLVTLL